MAASAPKAASESDSFEQALNDLLVSTFHSIERYEESVLQAASASGITVAEVHVIDAVGKAARQNPTGATPSLAAEMLGVSLPTVTASVNRLVKKGLLAKNRSATDARSVILSLTREGEKAYRLHALFHQRMAHTLAQNLSSEESAALVSGIRKLEAFFSAPIYASGKTSAASEHQEV